MIYSKYFLLPNCIVNDARVEFPPRSLRLITTMGELVGCGELGYGPIGQRAGLPMMIELLLLILIGAMHH